MTVTQSIMPSKPLYSGQRCQCHLVQGSLVSPSHTYQVRATSNGLVLGTIRWHAQHARYVFFSAERIAWTSRDLAEIGLWLRRLMHGPHPPTRHAKE